MAEKSPLEVARGLERVLRVLVQDRKCPSESNITSAEGVSISEDELQRLLQLRLCFPSKQCTTLLQAWKEIQSYQKDHAKIGVVLLV